MANGGGYVYFILGAAAGVTVVKIGYSDSHPETRFRGVQTISPVPLFRWGYVPGTRLDEGKLHKRFRRYRTHGEWFVVAEKLADFLPSVRNDWLAEGDPTDYELAVLSQVVHGGKRVEEAIEQAISRR